MNVIELIEMLEELPEAAEVWCLWDGELRSSIEHAYLGKTGYVVLADYDEGAYSDSGRPVDAPTQIKDQWWSTPDNPEDI